MSSGEQPAGGRGRVRLSRELGPGDVGTRVVVRRRFADGSAGDVLGELVRWSGGELVVRDRHGASVTVAEADVLAGKRIPPAPVRRHARLDDIALERVAALGWPALESEALGDWLLRASGGFTGRGNSVLVLGDSGRPLAATLAAVQRWYGARGLPAIAAVPLPAMAAVDAALVDAGWEPYNPTMVMTAPLDAVLAAAGGRDAAAGVEVSTELDDTWLAAYHYRGGTLPPVARRLLGGGDERAFATIVGPPAAGGGEAPALAIGRVALGAGWAGVTAVEVAEHARRQGHATRVMAALCGWAADHGARDVYLQMAEENAAARALYGRLGFTEHHRYRYLRAPGGQS